MVIQRKKRTYKTKQTRKSAYDYWVDDLLKQNQIKLKELKRNPLPTTDRTSGEHSVANALQRMNLRYIPEYVIDNLNGDTHHYRVADFWLPKDDIIIEYCGQAGWPEHKARYEEKRQVYLKNNRKHIFLYPQNLNNLNVAIMKRINFVMENGRGWNPELDGNGNAREEIITQYDNNTPMGKEIICEQVLDIETSKQKELWEYLKTVQNKIKLFRLTNYKMYNYLTYYGGPFRTKQEITWSIENINNKLVIFLHYKLVSMFKEFTPASADYVKKAFDDTISQINIIFK